jgi:hypothetical protein
VTFLHHLCSTCRYSIAAVSVVLVSACFITAQPPAASPTPVKAAIDSAVANQITVNDKVVGWSVFVTFTQEFAAADSTQAERPSNYKVINANTGSQIQVSEARFVPLTQGNQVTLQIVRLVLPSDTALNKDELFYLFAPNLLFKGVPTESVPMHQIKLEFATGNAKEVVVDQKGTNGADAHNPPRPAWGLSSAKDRDNSDLYVAYELTKARGIATTGTGDLKIAIPFLRNFWSRTSRFSPVVDVKASSDAGADPDSLKFALEWLLPVHLGNNATRRFPYSDIYMLNSAKVEAPKNFNNINSLWEHRWLFPSAQIPKDGKRIKMFLNPFAGAELGKNLKSPLPAADGKGITRVLVGASLAIQIPVEHLVALKGFEFTSSYIRRWSLISEILVDKDASGNLVALTLSKGPKDYLDSKFIIKVNDYFGPYVGYEWGRLPPNYELVDHKWTFGILFKSKVRAGGQ